MSAATGAAASLPQPVRSSAEFAADVWREATERIRFSPEYAALLDGAPVAADDGTRSVVVE